MTEQDLKQFVLTGSSADGLLTGDNFEAVKYQAYSLIDNLDFDGALKYANLLEKKITGYEPQNANHYNILWFWVNRLKLFAFSSLSINEQGDLLKNNVLKILQGDLDIKLVLYNFLIHFQSDDIILEYAKSFLSNMIKGQELLGADSDRFVRLNFNPTVENWCKEYISALNTEFRGAKIDPGAFNIVKFLDSNKYVKCLSKEEVKVLKDLLDLCNWLLSPLAGVQVVKNVPNLKPPVVPVPRGAPLVRGMGEIRVKSEKLQVKSGEQGNKTLTPALSQREREGNTNNESNFAKASSDLKKTAEGSAIDSLILKNQTGAGGSLAGAKPLTSTTLQERLYQGNNNQASGNNKTAQLRAVSGLNPVGQNRSLTDKYSITENENSSSIVSPSGGDGGNRTPETELSRIGSPPGHPHSNELYHSSAQVGQNRVNNQDVLYNRDITSPSPSLERRGMGTGGRSSPSFVLNPLLDKKPAVQNITPQPPLTLRGGGNKATEINRKLEELKKRSKN
jgi:hypothetical protein